MYHLHHLKIHRGESRERAAEADSGKAPQPLTGGSARFNPRQNPAKKKRS